MSFIALFPLTYLEYLFGSFIFICIQFYIFLVDLALFFECVQHEHASNIKTIQKGVLREVSFLPNPFYVIPSTPCR